MPVEKVNAATLRSAMEECMKPSARIVTDELPPYKNAAAGFEGGHVSVNHGDGEYVGSDGRQTNTAEAFFALLKRGIHGTFHHISKARRDAAVRGRRGSG